jgi:hypothetical protein
MARYRTDAPYRAWDRQHQARQRTLRQIAYIDRRLAALSSPEDDALIARLQAERAQLQERYR